MDKLSFYELGILETFGGQKNVKSQDVLTGSPDDSEETLAVLRNMFSKGLVRYDKAKKTFDFASLTYRI